MYVYILTVLQISMYVVCLQGVLHCTYYSNSITDTLISPAADIPTDASTRNKCIRALQVALQLQLRYELLSPFIVQPTGFHHPLNDSYSVHLSLTTDVSACVQTDKSVHRASIWNKNFKCFQWLTPQLISEFPTVELTMLTADMAQEVEQVIPLIGRLVVWSPALSACSSVLGQDTKLLPIAVPSLCDEQVALCAVVWFKLGEC